jgi:hypothetical protein
VDDDDLVKVLLAAAAAANTPGDDAANNNNDDGDRKLLLLLLPVVVPLSDLITLIEFETFFNGSVDNVVPVVNAAGIATCTPFEVVLQETCDGSDDDDTLVFVLLDLIVVVDDDDNEFCIVAVSIIRCNNCTGRESERLKASCNNWIQGRHDLVEVGVDVGVDVKDDGIRDDDNIEEEGDEVVVGTIVLLVSMKLASSLLLLLVEIRVEDLLQVTMVGRCGC